MPYVAPDAVPRAAAPGAVAPRPQAAANPTRAAGPPPMVAQAIPRSPPALAGADDAGAAPPYDDDAVIMPAPSADYLGHAPHAPAALHRPPGGGASGFLRDALVPVLFTCAVLMLAAAALKFVVHPDAPLALMPPWLTGVLVLAAVVFVAAGVMNIVLSRRAKRQGEGLIR
jgi:hypothetical protein